ncbi:hypothetical protein FA13DRAFT_1732288 [Coprinellus micaceus]|uniref:Uncharacterized protein n=1 Tax=Coprinellus micaceus TaxID=71717 RepID=A0A4Y7TCV5_COPMI|nr:hypothetical protein FA13DRAFT_1732288 [Coprinellus micaceus]
MEGPQRSSSSDEKELVQGMRDKKEHVIRKTLFVPVVIGIGVTVTATVELELLNFSFNCE